MEVFQFVMSNPKRISLSANEVGGEGWGEVEF